MPQPQSIVDAVHIMQRQEEDNLREYARNLAHALSTSVKEIERYDTDSTNPAYPRHGGIYHRAVIRFWNGNYLRVWTPDDRHWKVGDRQFEFYARRFDRRHRAAR